MPQELSKNDACARKHLFNRAIFEPAECEEAEPYQIQTADFIFGSKGAKKSPKKGLFIDAGQEVFPGRFQASRVSFQFGRGSPAAMG